MPITAPAAVTCGFAPPQRDRIAQASGYRQTFRAAPAYRTYPLAFAF
jgi:hypothetical protein